MQELFASLSVKSQVLLPSARNHRLMVRIKDIGMFTTLRDNQLVGYGLVVGLNGTGDSLGSSPYTKESLISMLERLGVNIRDGAVPSGKSIAAVMVTASLPPFARVGSRISVNVSVLGDAKDLRGGTLLVTPLLGADGDVYAVAQGSVNAAGIAATGAAATQTNGVPTTGSVPSGAIVEKEINFQLANVPELILSLRNPDIATSHRVRKAINNYFSANVANALDNATIRIKVPEARRKDMVGFMNDIEQIEVSPDERAKVIIDPNTGVIVMTQNVKISPVALNHGQVTIRVVEHPDVYQPQPFTNSIPPEVVLESQKKKTNNTILDELKVRNRDFDRSFKKRRNQLYEQIDTIRLNYSKQIKSASAITAVGAVAALTKEQVQNNLRTEREEKITAAYQAFDIRDKTLRKSHQSNLENMRDQLNDVSQEGGGSRLVPIPTATVIDNSTVEITEEKGKFALVNKSVDLQEVVNALNLLGVTPSEMMHILQGLQRAGALHAEVIVN